MPENPQLALTFARAPSGETYLKRQYAAFPFHVTQPFRDGRDSVLILQSLGAGLVQGDRFRAEILVERDARARVETQGSTIAHAMPDGDAVQTVQVEIMPGARLVYLPRPLVLFPGARVAAGLEIIRHPGAEVIWCDSFLPHEPGDGGTRSFERLLSETVVRDGDGAVLTVDRFEIPGAVRDEPGVMARLPVHATLGWLADGLDADSLVRDIAPHPEPDGAYSGTSSLPGGIGVVTRILAPDGAVLDRVLKTAIATLCRAGSAAACP